MVRIIIETDEATTVRSQEQASISPQEATAAAAGQSTAPAEVLAAAAAIGAQDAGPAPVAPATTGMVSGAPDLPLATPGAPVVSSKDLDAGAAPGTQAEPPPSTVTAEDGE